MRMSCNGCRVLRKGCSENCSIRPCLQWIKTPQSQANATFFLAKFYGRAGLVNLINAGPHHLRPAIFKSLLFEACGRIVNPMFGSAGLLWSGSWQLCEDAVEAVLKGEPIVSVSDETAASHMNLPLKGCDIRHVSKEYESSSSASASASASIRKIKTRRRFKRVQKSKPKECLMFEFEIDHESVLSQRRSNGGGGGDNGDCLSMETVEASVGAGKGADVELELNLGSGIQLDERDADVSILWKRHV